MNPQQAQQELPHDIVGIITHPDYLMWGIWAFIATIILAGLWWLWRKHKNKQPAKANVRQPKIDPILEVSKKIAALSPEEPFNRKAQEDFFFSLSMLFREYIEYRFGFSATDLTLKELRQPLAFKLPLPKEETGEVLRFFERADMVKFAEREANKEEALKDKAAVVTWVDKMKPPRPVMDEAYAVKGRS